MANLRSDKEFKNAETCKFMHKFCQLLSGIVRNFSRLIINTSRQTLPGELRAGVLSGIFEFLTFPNCFFVEARSARNQALRRQLSRDRNSLAKRTSQPTITLPGHAPKF